MYKSIREKRTPKVFCNLKTGEVTDLITRTQRLDRTKKKVKTKLVPVIGGGLFKKFVRVNK